MGQHGPHTSCAFTDWKSKFLSTSYAERLWIKWQYYNSLCQSRRGEINLEELDDAFLHVDSDGDVEDLDPQQITRDWASFSGIWVFDGEQEAMILGPEATTSRFFRGQLQSLGRLFKGKSPLLS